jgi:hypothetical protein
MKLREYQKKRLRKLYNFVDAHVSPKNFGMTYYRYNIDPSSSFPSTRVLETNELLVEQTNVNNCGTSGCLMGWTPFALKEVYKKHKLLPKFSYLDVDWVQASNKLFGLKIKYSEWSYLFDSRCAFKNGKILSGRSQKRSALTRLQNFIESNGELTPAMKRHMKSYGVDLD